MKKKKIKLDKDGYEDTEDFDGVRMEDLIEIDDPRLPSPSELAKSIRNNRITLLLDDAVVSFFKDQAKENKVSYQQLIREVLREYMRLKRSTRSKAA